MTFPAGLVVSLRPTRKAFEAGTVTEQDGLVLFELDAAVQGNWNTGHEYGWNWEEEDRMALIEYLKIHKDPEPAAGN